MAFEITRGIEESKPILPPLHTLNLPFISSRPSYDNLQYDHRNSQTYSHSRRISTSSSCTSPSDESASPPPPSFSLPTKFRLEPCTLDKADAVILVPPPSSTANSGKLTRSKTQTSSSPSNKPLFLVGPALHHFRLRPPSSRPLAKGARMHPYRILRDNNLRRRSSTVSFTGLTHIRLPLQDLKL